MKKWKKKNYHDFTFFMIQCSYSINFIFKLTSQSKKKIKLISFKIIYFGRTNKIFQFSFLKWTKSRSLQLKSASSDQNCFMAGFASFYYKKSNVEMNFVKFLRNFMRGKKNKK